jgi:hypothetical protein
MEYWVWEGTEVHWIGSDACRKKGPKQSAPGLSSNDPPHSTVVPPHAHAVQVRVSSAPA